MTVTGGCRCGACRYTLDLPDLPPVYACHCHVCQRATGSAFSVQAAVVESKLTITGPVIIREIRADDRLSVQRFCGECYARIYNTNTAWPGIAVVRGGTLDQSEELACRAHIFTNYKQTWVKLGDGVPQWGEAADPAAFVAVLWA